MANVEVICAAGFTLALDLLKLFVEALRVLSRDGNLRRIVGRHVRLRNKLRQLPLQHLQRRRRRVLDNLNCECLVRRLRRRLISQEADLAEGKATSLFGVLGTEANSSTQHIFDSH